MFGLIYTKSVIEAQSDFREKTCMNQEFFAILFAYRGDKIESLIKRTVKSTKIENVFWVTIAAKDQILA